MGKHFLLVFLFAGLLMQAQTPEVLYLSDEGTSGDGVSYLYKVDLVLGSPNQANLTLLPSGAIPFNNVLALAATADGSKLYAIDLRTSNLGYYDVGTAAFWVIGVVQTAGAVRIESIPQAAFSPFDGKLYVASDSAAAFGGSQFRRWLYTVDTTTAVATPVGEILLSVGPPKVYLNVVGADLAFGADGTLYLWTSDAGTPAGLYALVPGGLGPNTVAATRIGPTGAGPFVTGLAIRDNGFGDMVGSVSNSSSIVAQRNHVIEISKANGSTLNMYRMYNGGAPFTEFTHTFGDMSVGPLVVCTRTIGYWKNHLWGGREVTILGVQIGETFGKEILWSAKGSNFSMFFAQLIAAKLNTDGFFPPIVAAESFLQSLGGAFFGLPPGPLNYSREFASKAQKAQAAPLWEALDGFNNQYPCEP